MLQKTDNDRRNKGVMNRQTSYTIGEVLRSDQQVHNQQIALVFKYKAHYMFRLLYVAICR